MKILFDTVNSDFYCALIDNNFNLIQSVHQENIREKVELIPKIFNLLLINNNLTVNDVKEFYINIGPGSFTGSRISLVFCRTIAKILENIKIYVISNFLWLSKITSILNEEILIPGGGKKFFKAKVQKNKIISEIEIVEQPKEKTKMNYKIFEKNVKKYLSRFEEISDIDEIEPFYLKNPQIGSTK